MAYDTMPPTKIEDIRNSILLYNQLYVAFFNSTKTHITSQAINSGL